MSAKAMGMVFDRYPASDGEFKLALALADNASEDGRNIYPSVATMARKSRQDVRSVQRHLKHMLAIGWLQKVKNGGGRGRATEYRINPRWMRGEELPLKGDTAPGFAKGDTAPGFAAEERVTPATRKGDTGDGAYMNHKEPSVTPLTPQGGSAGFDALCKAYPRRRVNYKAALDRWDELKPDQALQAIMVREAGRQASSPEWQAENGKAVPNLSKWILNRGWMATYEEAAPAAQTAVTREQGAPAPRLSPEQLQENRRKADAHIGALRARMQRKAEEVDA